MGHLYPHRCFAAPGAVIRGDDGVRSLCRAFGEKIWSHIGIAFALLYAALVEIVYVTWLFVVEPHVLRGQANQVALLIFTPGSFLQMVDGLGYTFMMIAVFFTAPGFSNRGFERWIRWAGIANGIFAIPVFLSYVYYSFILGLWWGITIPAFSLLLAVYFWRAGVTTRQSNTPSDPVVRSEVDFIQVLQTTHCD